jgi:signal transduction histidine kinase
MSGIGSTFRRHWVEVAWGAFALVNLVVIVLVVRWETIPFHFIWVSLTIVYGFRTWRLSHTLAVLGVVVLLTTWALTLTVVRGHEHPDELAEVPLMAAMFVAMVWHARRRQAAIEEARRLAETEHRLVEAQREFISDASHELRTPITIARGHSELVRDAPELGSQTHADVEVVLDELDRLSRLSERLLLLASAEHPGFLSVALVDVGPLIEGMGRRWRGAADRAWSMSVVDPGTISLDRERFEIALDAVVENAVQATMAGDPIVIETRAEGSDLVVEVVDGGPGISHTQLDRIFDRFTRADADRTRGGGGTGLGLPIARAIARAHGGDLTAERGPGGGSVLRFRLPGFTPSLVRRIPDAALAT